jgi:hypothetical protein
MTRNQNSSNQPVYYYKTGDRVYHVIRDSFGTVKEEILYPANILNVWGHEIWYIVKWDDGLGQWSAPCNLLLPEKLVKTTLYELIYEK